MDNLQDRLTSVHLNHAKIARILKRKHRQEIWRAINTDLYPILKQRIVKLVENREAKNGN